MRLFKEFEMVLVSVEFFPLNRERQRKDGLSSSVIPAGPDIRPRINNVLAVFSGTKQENRNYINNERGGVVVMANVFKS